MKKYLLLINLLFLTSFLWSQGLKTQGKIIVDTNGNEIILKGAGLGGWMLMEGYMMQSSDVADTQHEFRERLEELIGESKTDEFFDVWLANHVTKADIDSLAKWGFNSVRLPMHYNLFTLPIEKESVAGQNTWLDKGFTMVDDLLDWCEANQMYLILDLHAAPGGQGANAAISDYDTDKPSLWESEENRAKTVALWGKLAERYKDEPWMGGYDLLNEVNWNLPGGTMLRTLYEEITTEIRKVDTDHIIFIEGNWFANDFTGLTPAWDSNMVYSFHKYWSFNDQASIQWVLDLRESENVPLWMGEAGENSNTWFQEAISLFEKNGIGWSWWPMKRIETTVSPYSILFSDGYKNILEYWRGNVAKPSEADAYTAMMELANNTASNKCSYHKDVQDAQLRQITTDETKPFSELKIPGTIHMSEYDLGKNNFAYYDIDAANYQLSTNQFQAWNAGWTYRNDGVDIEKNTDDINSNGYHVGFTNKGEWIKYTVQIEESGIYKLETRLAGENAGGQFHISLNGEAITTTQITEATGSWTTFATHTTNNVSLEQGIHALTVHFDGDVSFNISSINFAKTGDLDSLDAIALNGELVDDESSIQITVNQDLLESSLTDAKDDFSIIVNGVAQVISEISLMDAKKRTIQLGVDRSFLSSDEIRVSYDGSSVSTISGKSLSPFSELVISNNLPVRSALPGKIEAENFTAMSGLQTEDTSDEGGGKNIGYTDAGDYADYLIFVDLAGNYKVKFRFASEWAAGRIGLYLVADDLTETELVELDTPVTGGWQTWTTISSNLSLPNGISTLRMRVLAGGFNMNWMEFQYDNIIVDDVDNDGVIDTEDDCLNTREGVKVNIHGCEIFSLPNSNFELRLFSETCKSSNNGSISITAKEDYSYTATLTGNTTKVSTFNSQTSFDNLEAGDFILCITIEGKDAYEQCFNLVIIEPEALKVSSKTDSSNSKVTLSLEGSDSYFITFNEELIRTSENEITLDLVQSKNTISVKTNSDCQGVYEETILLNNIPLLYPNPVQSNTLFINTGVLSDVSVIIQVFSVSGNLILSNAYSPNNGRIEIDLAKIPAGIFIFKITTSKEIFNYKIIRQ